MFAYYPLPADAGGGGSGGPLSVYVDPNPAEYYEPYYLGTATVKVFAIVNGGKAPVTYKWTYLTGDTQIYPVSFTSGDNEFVLHSEGFAAVYNATWRLTVTDSLGATASVDLPVRLAVGTSPP